MGLEGVGDSLEGAGYSLEDAGHSLEDCMAGWVNLGEYELLTHLGVECNRYP